ncbi:DUF222 domain-containing protein [Nocardiopsis mangrovi]|uniref:DUF222 domain-containing protein n=1 Tax=Nocardiopsis mangrovi TaxID=1179818 RepID=A0ABV9E118_9ACTN
MSNPATTALREGATPDDRHPPAGGFMADWVLTLDTASMTGDEQLDLIARAEFAKRWLDAFQLDAMAAFTRTRAEEAPPAAQISVEEDAAAEIGCELGIPPGLSRSRIEHAKRLGEDFPALHQALVQGRIDEYRTRVITEAVPEDWDTATIAAYQQRILANMGDKSGVRLKNLAKKTVLALDPARAEERRARTIALRQVRVDHGEAAHSPGTGSVNITDIDATDALAIHQRLGSIARALRTDTPGVEHMNGATRELTLDQLRADVAVMLLLGRLPLTFGIEEPPENTDGTAGDPAAGEHQVRIPGVAVPEPVPFSPVGKLHVIIPLAALPKEMGGKEVRALGEIPGHGPILADAARELAKGATSKATLWCYTVVDEEGNPVADGTTAYRPPPRLRSHIDSRDRTCRFPHCNRPAVECDADHTTPHHRGGPTSPANLAALCRRHHRLKQARGWSLAQPSPGTLVWRTPHNRTHTTVPDPYPDG